MATKRLNPNLAKIHRSYTVEEAAEMLGVHKRTVRNWIKSGLPVIDERRPLLILGTDLKVFIRQQRKRNRRQCKTSEIYCLRCREPRQPSSETVKFIQEAGGIGRVFAQCCKCGSKVNKYFSWRSLDSIRRELLVESTVSTKTHKYEGYSSPELYLT
ncbi:helix-turn-helix domain-containing protein [Vibrio natriegens]|uniref:helix-turn-helix domain-containing protein n=1 Tax=Vibrio natriegens TaxID=691 RepID=UPI003F841867